MILPPPSSDRTSKALRRLKTNPCQSISLARAGSYDDMYALVNVSHINIHVRRGLDRIPRNLHPAVFEMFCSHLQDTELRSGSEDDKRLQVFFVSYSIVGIWAFRDRAESLSTDARYKELLKLTWNGIFFWLQKLGETELSDLVMTGRLAFPYLLRNAFDMFENQEDLKGLLKSEEVIAFVTRIWLQNHPSATREDIQLLSMISFTFLNHSRADSDTNFKVVIQTAKVEGFHVAEILAVAFRRLRSSLDPLNFDAAWSHLQVISFLCSGDLKFVAAFAQVRGISKILRTLQKLDLRSEIGPPLDSFSRHTTSSQCLDILHWILEMSDSAQQYIKASLKPTLFEAILSIKPVRPTDEEHIFGFILDIFSPYLSISSVASCASNALMKIASSNKNIFSDIQTGIIKSLWDGFLLLLAERIILRTLLDRRAKRLSCDNPTCRKIGPREAFKACASCSHVVYCSISCQKSSWCLYGHKELCRAHASSHPRTTALTRSDRRFVKELAIIEVSRHASILFKEAPECQDLEFGDIGFCVNFALSTPLITVLPFPFNILDDTIADSNTRQKMLLSKGRYRGSTFIEIKVPIGRDNTETLMCLGEVEESRGLIVQRPGQGIKASSELRAGLRAGGSPRDASIGDGDKELYADYDEIDELIRRIHMESERLKRPLFDAGLIAVVVDQYLLEVDDTTPARFS